MINFFKRIKDFLAHHGFLTLFSLIAYISVPMLAYIFAHYWFLKKQLKNIPYSGKKILLWFYILCYPFIFLSGYLVVFMRLVTGLNFFDKLLEVGQSFVYILMLLPRQFHFKEAIGYLLPLAIFSMITWAALANIILLMISSHSFHKKWQEMIIPATLASIGGVIVSYGTGIIVHMLVMYFFFGLQ